MKKSLFSFLLLLIFVPALSQTLKHFSDSLKKQLPQLRNTARVDQLNRIAESVSAPSSDSGWRSKADTSYKYAMMAYHEGKKLNYTRGIAIALNNLGTSRWYKAIPIIWKAKVDTAAAFSTIREGVSFLNQSIAISEKLNDHETLGRSYNTLAMHMYYLNKQDPTIKEFYFKKSLEHFNKAGNLKIEQEVNTWLCESYGGRGLFEESLPYCQRSLELALKTPIKAQFEDERQYRHFLVQQALADMANTYMLAGDHETALSYTRQNREYYQKNKTNWSMNAELGEVFVRMNQFDSAFYYLNAAQAEKSKDIYVKIDLAYTYVGLKEYDMALNLLKAPLDSFAKGKSTWRILMPIAMAYAGKKDYNTALKYATESYKIDRKDNRYSMMNMYKLFSEIYNGLKQHDSAYKYLEQYHSLKDSVFNRQLIWKLNNYKRAALDQKKAMQIALLSKDNQIKAQLLQQQYLLKEQKEAHITLLNKDNEIKEQQLMIKEQELMAEKFLKEQKQAQLALLDRENKLKGQQLKQEVFFRNSLFGGLILLLLLGIFSFRILSLKRKNEKLRLEKEMEIQRLQSEQKQLELQHQAAELEMQALRAQMNPHFIFNALSSINNYILKNDSETASDYLTRFSRLIRLALTHSQLSMIPLQDELEMLRLYLDMERLRFNNTFDYEIVFSNSINPDSIYVPPMLLQPFCENAIWHGLMHKKGQGYLKIALTATDRDLCCTITDNGVGLSKSAALKSRSIEKRKSFGLQITTQRLALFNGDQNVPAFYTSEELKDEQEQVKGTKVVLHIKHKNTVRELV